MNVLLINPPHTNAVGMETPFLVRENEGVFPPLGILYIASYLKQRIDCRIRVLDMAAEGIDNRLIGLYLRDIRPEIVGITSHTHNLPDIVSLMRCIKDTDKNIHICLGGPHVNIFPGETMQLPYVDSAVAGEGEITFSELVQCLQERADPGNVKGLFFRKGDRIIETGSRENNIMPDELPFPERGLLSLQKYHSILGRDSLMTTMISSRGCPFRCSFCSTPRGAFRQRSPKNIADEMEGCLAQGIDEIHFVDDTFNVDPERVIQICDEMEKRRLKVRWSFRGRVDGITGQLLQKAKKAGCYRIHLGVETSTDEGLAALKKGITLGQVRAAFAGARQAGISTVAYFLIGCPHEKSAHDVLKTIDFSCELDPDFALFNLLTPYPSTQLYEDGLKKRVLAPEAWQQFVLSPSPDFKPPLWEEYMKKEELVSLLNMAFRRFYLRPAFITRMLFEHSNMNMLAKKIKAGFEICRLRSGKVGRGGR